LDKLHEECGIFGIYDESGSTAESAYFALMALQHRGQESCGIAVNKNRQIFHHKESGLVNEVFNEKRISELNGGHMAVGHVRYSTLEKRGRENAQPLVINYVKGMFAVAHNGNIINYDNLKKKYEKTGAIYQTESDSEIIAYTIARERINSHSIERAVVNSMKHLQGAYSLIVMSPEKLIAARDPRGIRPLCMGRLKNGGVVFASESCALDAINAEFERDILPGEVVVVVRGGKVTSYKDNCGAEKSALCIFEYVYFARTDSVIEGQFVHEARKLAGRLLAKKNPVEADIVIGVPDSALGAAKGYSLESGIPIEDGFIRNTYVGRTFIRANQASREKAVRVKLNPIRTNVKGQRVVMVDDSIVRGTTSAYIVKSLRDAGAKEVHVRICAPPYSYPCYYGTDIPSKKDLIIHRYSIEETRKYIGADTLEYLTFDDLMKIAPNSATGFCSACFTGEYPVLPTDIVPDGEA
jgi:amidophosphoribosyltransferase